MKLALTAGLALAFVGTAFAAEAPKTDKEKASYAIGLDMGNSVKALDIDLNADFIAQGIRDAISGKPALKDEEVQAALMGLQKEVQGKMEAKQKELAQTNADASKKFLDENAKKEGVKTTASGLQYKVVKEGKGPKPTLKDTVEVKYKGTLVNGTEFDNSEKHPQGPTASFPIEGIIPGWTEALQLMPVGSTWELYIPANLAYGEQAPPMIGPNQALIFTVELVGIKKDEEKKEETKEEKK
jgi:FKBP-type peptidyl-prolyl cis-trans isomerase